MDENIVLTSDELKCIVQETVRETLLTLGIDHDDPLEMQRDFQHVRSLRLATENIQKKGLLTLVGILATGLAAAAWLGFKSAVKAGIIP